MSIRAALLLLVLTPAPPVRGEVPQIKLPAEVRGDVGDFITVSADTNGKEVKWVALDRDLRVFPAAMLRDSRMTVVTARRAGQYRLVAYTALADVPSDPAGTVVTITDPAPPIGPDPPAPIPERPWQKKPATPAPRRPAVGEEPGPGRWLPNVIDHRTGARAPAVASAVDTCLCRARERGVSAVSRPHDNSGR